MTPDNRRFLDEKHGGNVSAFVNAAVADFRRSEDALSDARDHRARTARRVAAIHAGHGNAVDAALSLLGDDDDPAITARLTAMLLTRVQRLGIEGANAAPHLLVALDQALDTTEPEVQQCEARVGSSSKSRRCSRDATVRVTRPDGVVACYCKQHASKFAAPGTPMEAL